METTEISMEELERITSQDNKSLATTGEREVVQATVFIGKEDYKQPENIIWFELAGKAFPTKRVNQFLIMKLAKAQNDVVREPEDEDIQARVMACTYDLIMAMIPAKYKPEFETHMGEAEYEDDEMNTAIEDSMSQWANKGNTAVPLAEKNDMSGLSMQQSDSLTLKEVSLHSGKVTERPLTEQERAVHQSLMQKKSITGTPV